jgi:hypothetical protein
MNTDAPFDLAGFSPFPSAAETLQDLDDFVPLLWEGMEWAVGEAVTFFGIEPVCPNLFPNLVRYYAKRFFLARHLAATDEETSDTPAFEQIGLANNGLCVVRHRYALRIRKSDNGLVPVPGSSTTLQQFYRQQPLPFNLVDRPAQAVDTSLLLLWDIDAKYNFAGLQLSCPSAGETTRASVQTHWSVSLANPIIASPATASTALFADLDEIQPLEDTNTAKRLG